MPRRLLYFVVAMCSASTAFAQAPARDRQPPSDGVAGTGIIRGRVTLSGTDQPLARADVLPRRRR